MKAAERAERVEYILKHEFAGRGWSKWMLTHASPGLPTPEVAQKRQAQNGVEAEIASRRMALEALSDGELEHHHLTLLVSELESALVAEQAKAGRLQRKNEELRNAAHVDAADKPLDPRERSSMLRIVGALIHGYNCEIEDYNHTEDVEKHPAKRKRPLDTANPQKAAKAIEKMSPEPLDPRTIVKYVTDGIQTTAGRRGKVSTSKT